MPLIMRVVPACSTYVLCVVMHCVVRVWVGVCVLLALHGTAAVAGAVVHLHVSVA
jgi:hypothetical protein